VRWVDLGCPIDLTFDKNEPTAAPRGWLLDDQRPTLALSHPQPGTNRKFDRLLIGMHDVGSGLDLESLEVIADFTIDGSEPGTNLADKLKSTTSGVWEWKFAQPLAELETGTLVVSVRDRQGNATKVERAFHVVP
jgi:hypothetical protein